MCLVILSVIASFTGRGNPQVSIRWRVLARRMRLGAVKIVARVLAFEPQNKALKSGYSRISPRYGPGGGILS